MEHTLKLISDLKRIFVGDYPSPNFEFVNPEFFERTDHYPDWTELTIKAKAELLNLFSTSENRDQLIEHFDRELFQLGFPAIDAIIKKNRTPERLLAAKIYDDFYDWFRIIPQVEIYLDRGNNDDDGSEEVEGELMDVIPEYELKTQKEQIRLLYDLGVIDFLQKRYPATLKHNNNQTAIIISQILKLNRTSVQPTINALLNDNTQSDKYPKESNLTKAILARLNAAESI